MQLQHEVAGKREVAEALIAVGVALGRIDLRGHVVVREGKRDLLDERARFHVLAVGDAVVLCRRAGVARAVSGNELNGHKISSPYKASLCKKC